jgi:glyoxylase-like metal-dependent hydrolase (beta-lactamase superfamily II)
MEVAPGVEMLELSATLMNGPGTLYPTMLWDQHDAVLVDAGLPDMAQQFLKAITQTGVPFEKLGRIIITHHDLDHIGSLGELQRSASRRIEVLSHPDEVPYIQGERPPIKLTPKMLAQMEAQMKDMPEERRKGMRAMMESMGKQKLKVDRTLGDGEELPYCGGIQIIHTPGHTPGHICLYHNPSRTLIAGDALFVDGRNLGPAPSFIHADVRMAMASIKKLTDYDIANVIAYHGGLFQDDPNKRLKEIVEGN